MKWLQRIILVVLLMGGGAWADKIPAELIGTWDLVGQGVAPKVNYNVIRGVWALFEADGKFEKVIHPSQGILPGDPPPVLATKLSGTYKVKGNTLLWDTSWKTTFSVVRKKQFWVLTITEYMSPTWISVYRRKA